MHAMGPAPVGRPAPTTTTATTGGGDAENLTTLFVGAIPAGVNDGWIEKLLTVSLLLVATLSLLTLAIDNRQTETLEAYERSIWQTKGLRLC